MTDDLPLKRELAPIRRVVIPHFPPCSRGGPIEANPTFCAATLFAALALAPLPG
jgi:hypothetical protein